MNPGRIQRKGTFLWQEDSPSGCGMNLWSGLLSANNGYPETHALKAAALFGAAPELLQALQGLLNEAHSASKPLHGESECSQKARAAIAKALGEQP